MEIEAFVKVHIYEQNEEARMHYEELKQHLAIVNKTNKYQYAADKTEFVRYILEAIEK